LLPIQQVGPSFLSLGFLFQFIHWGVVLGQFLTWNHSSSSFSLYFNLNKCVSNRSRFFLRDFVIWVWWCVVRRLVRRCLISHLVMVFIWFILKDRLFNQRFRCQPCRSRGIGVLITLILSYILVGIMQLYAINFDGVSLFADSYFTFLAVLNDVLYRFERMNIVLFL